MELFEFRKVLFGAGGEKRAGVGGIILLFWELGCSRIGDPSFSSQSTTPPHSSISLSPSHFLSSLVNSLFLLRLGYFQKNGPAIPRHDLRSH